jgi:hypothetical protein
LVSCAPARRRHSTSYEIRSEISHIGYPERARRKAGTTVHHKYRARPAALKEEVRGRKRAWSKLIMTWSDGLLIRENIELGRGTPVTRCRCFPPILRTPLVARARLVLIRVQCMSIVMTAGWKRIGQTPPNLWFNILGNVMTRISAPILGIHNTHPGVRSQYPTLLLFLFVTKFEYTASHT